MAIEEFFLHLIKVLNLPGLPHENTKYFKNSKPYENIPFQFSLHIQENENSELKHVEYISKDKKILVLNFHKNCLKAFSGCIIFLKVML